jgi:hypothetical protein
MTEVVQRDTRHTLRYERQSYLTAVGQHSDGEDKDLKFYVLLRTAGVSNMLLITR